MHPITSKLKINSQLQVTATTLRRDRNNALHENFLDSCTQIRHILWKMENHIISAGVHRQRRKQFRGKRGACDS